MLMLLQKAAFVIKKRFSLEIIFFAKS